MRTGETVIDEKGKLTDEQIGKIQRKTNEIVRRINGGTIFFDDVIAGMQGIIEGGSKRLKIDLIPEKKWLEKDDVIYLKVTSDGTSGPNWIERLEKQGFKLDKYAKDLLWSKDFKATTNIVYTIAVLKGNLFIDSGRITKKIRSEAKRRNLVTPNPEVACLIREMFSDAEIAAMRLDWIAVFHRSIKGSNGDFNLLHTKCTADNSCLNTRYDNPVLGWSMEHGFAFEVSRKPVQI
jgi:hypothetical protein